MFHPKIGCFNFKEEYLLNYSSPKNDLYSVRKRSIRAFKSIFKLLGWGPASAGLLRAKFFARSPPLACFVLLNLITVLLHPLSFYAFVVIPISPCSIKFLLSTSFRVFATVRIRIGLRKKIKSGRVR